MIKVLVVYQICSLSRDIMGFLSKRGIHVTLVTQVEEARATLSREEDFSLIITEASLYCFADGQMLAQEKCKHIPVLIISCENCESSGPLEQGIYYFRSYNSIEDILKFIEEHLPHEH